MQTFGLIVPCVGTVALSLAILVKTANYPRDGDFDLTNFSRSFAQRVQNRKNGKNYEAPANCPELTVEDGRGIRHVVPCLSKSGNGVQMLVTTTFSGR
jgi:hypothetical protein